jgi:hypothetical protein
MSAERGAWNFQEAHGMRKQFRGAPPLYIAYYLDRIKRHLEKIAASSQSSERTVSGGRVHSGKTLMSHACTKKFSKFPEPNCEQMT